MQPPFLLQKLNFQFRGKLFWKCSHFPLGRVWHECQTLTGKQQQTFCYPNFYSFSLFLSLFVSLSIFPFCLSLLSFFVLPFLRHSFYCSLLSHSLYLSFPLVPSFIVSHSISLTLYLSLITCHYDSLLLQPLSLCLFSKVFLYISLFFHSLYTLFLCHSLVLSSYILCISLSLSCSFFLSLQSSVTRIHSITDLSLSLGSLK